MLLDKDYNKNSTFKSSMSDIELKNNIEDEKILNNKKLKAVTIIPHDTNSTNDTETNNKKCNSLDASVNTEYTFYNLPEIPKK